MFGLREILGLMICVGPPIIIVAALIWATRRPKCQNCRYAISPDDSACPKCGHLLTPRSVP